MFIKLYEENQEKNLNEIEHLNNILKDLEDAKNNIPKKEYEYEKERITYYLEKEKVKLQENAELIKNYKIIKNELFSIEKLKQFKINDKYDKKEYEEELSKRLETIKYYSKNMPQEIYEEIILEINNEFENQTKKGFIDDEVSEEVIQEVSNESIEEEKEPNELEVITDNEISQEPVIEEIKEPVIEPTEEIEHTEVTPKIIEENTKLSGEPTIYEGNVILLPASSDELSKEDSNDTPIELASKAIEIIDSLKDEEEQETNKEESQEENNGEEELEVEEVSKANPTLISKIKEKMKKYSPKSLISNYKDKHKEQELTEEESQEENNGEEELEVEEVSKANPTLISKIKEKMKKYSPKSLISNYKDKHKEQELTEEESQEENNNEEELKVEEVSKANPTLISKIKEKMKHYKITPLKIMITGAAIAVAATSPAAFCLVGNTVLIGLNIKYMFVDNCKKKIKRKGIFLAG